MGLTLLPLIIIIFIHSPGLFLEKLLRRLLKGKAVAPYAARPSESQGCVLCHCPHHLLITKMES